jgi:hypothetical protein
MMRTILSITAAFALIAAVLYARAADESVENHIIALERGALERWGKGDTQGFLDLMSNDETYSIPASESGLTAWKPFASTSRRSRGKLASTVST